MKRILKLIISKSTRLRHIYLFVMTFYFKFFDRPYKPAETTKARQRRLKESFFQKYTKGHGIDIGFGGDPIVPNCRGWDVEDGDAQYLKGIKDNSFDFVYSSHTLEHVLDPMISLRNWWRILKSNGYLILYIPHRDLYEKKKNLPSKWNPDHKCFFLLNKNEMPDTISIISLIQRTLSNFEIIYGKECSQRHTITDPEIHSDGEYSIEVVVLKKPNNKKL